MISRFGFVVDTRTTLVMRVANMFDARPIDDAQATVNALRLICLTLDANMFDARRIGDARSDGQREYV
jgi:hypothetical protein